MNAEPSKYAPPVEKTSRCIFPDEGWWSEENQRRIETGRLTIRP